MRTALTFLFLLCVASSAHAATLTYDDQALFLASTGATSATGPLPNLGDVGYTPTTVGDVTYTSAAQFMTFNNDPSPIPGSHFAIGDEESFNLDLVAPVNALGFDWTDPDPSDGSFVMTLVSGGVGGTVVDSVAFAASTPNALSFFGVSSNVAFDRVEIRETQVVNVNEFFGEVYTGAVPEPTSCALLALAAAGLVCGRHGKRA